MPRLKFIPAVGQPVRFVSSTLRTNQTKIFPLENPKDQKEFLELLKKDSLGTNEYHRDYVPFKHDDSLFVDDINTQTGEVGGPKGSEPTRYGDWERKGRVFDF